uniref:Uncharacterized protein n=1 Tax=Anguilla anguilla TaxID=7936 RepID=A0A0E9X874_ANGAN
MNIPAYIIVFWCANHRLCECVCVCVRACVHTYREGTGF